jgi:hypothetical protein
MNDLVALVADRNMESAVRGLLSRWKSLNIHPVTCNIYVHPQRDPGCWNEADSFLRPFSNQYNYALVLFDHEGSGQEGTPADHLQENLEKRLDAAGWNDRCRVIVLQPELEIWVWSDSPAVDESLGWSGRQPDLRTWLRERGLLGKNTLKPDNPKEAMDRALREVSRPHSSAIFRQLAEKVPLRRCTDPCFERFCSTLQIWFPHA